MLERIRRRLTLGYVGILALILVLFGAIVVGVFSHQLAREQDSRLMREAESVADFVQSHEPGSAREADLRQLNVGGSTAEPPLPTDEGHRSRGDEDIAIAAYVVPPETLPDGAKASDGIYGAVPDPNAEHRDLGLPATELAREAEREDSRDGRPGDWPGDRPDVGTVESPEGEVRVLSVPVRSQSGEVVAVVQVAQSSEVVGRTVKGLISVLVPVGIGSLLLAGLGGLFMSRRAMRPVRDSFQRQRTFVADASHELKTPLALVKIGAEVIKRNPTDPENEEIVDDQLSEIDRMNALLSELLLLARLDAGRLDVEEKPFDLSVIAAETAGRFLKRAANEGVRLEVEVPDRLPVRGDPDRTAQILTALLDNAVRHTPEGGTVTISGRSFDNAVEAIIRDTGPGIPPEHLPRIFDRFYRAEEARTRAGGGSGLGLSIARDLAHAQGGDLSAENAAARGETGGAIFRLRLPGQ